MCRYVIMAPNVHTHRYSPTSTRRRTQYRLQYHGTLWDGSYLPNAGEAATFHCSPWCVYSPTGAGQHCEGDGEQGREKIAVQDGGSQGEIHTWEASTHAFIAMHMYIVHVHVTLIYLLLILDNELPCLSEKRHLYVCVTFKNWPAQLGCFSS